jgi:hypothetical protein
VRRDNNIFIGDCGVAHIWITVATPLTFVAVAAERAVALSSPSGASQLAISNKRSPNTLYERHNQAPDQAYRSITQRLTAW